MWYSAALSVENRISASDNSTKKHFHILWLPRNILDWEPFDTRKEAEAAARDFARKDESHSIKEFDSTSCPSPICKAAQTGTENA